MPSAKALGQRVPNGSRNRRSDTEAPWRQAGGRGQPRPGRENGIRTRASPPGKGRQADGLAPAGPAREPRRGEPSAGPDPWPLPHLGSGAETLHPEGPGEDGHPYRPHRSPRARRGGGGRGGWPGPAGGRCPSAGRQQRWPAAANSLAVDTSQQPGRSCRRPTWALPAETGSGKQESPTGWPSPLSPTLPGGSSPFSFRQSAASRLPSGPFKNGTAAASLPALALGRATPTDQRGRGGRHVTADGGGRGSKLAGRGCLYVPA